MLHCSGPNGKGGSVEIERRMIRRRVKSSLIECVIVDHQKAKLILYGGIEFTYIARTMLRKMAERS
jgi:hypothetical protein